MHEECIVYTGMPIGMLKATSNGEKIKPVALVVIKLHLSENISQSVENSIY